MKISYRITKNIYWEYVYLKTVIENWIKMEEELSGKFKEDEKKEAIIALYLDYVNNYVTAQQFCIDHNIWPFEFEKLENDYYTIYPKK